MLACCFVTSRWLPRPINTPKKIHLHIIILNFLHFFISSTKKCEGKNDPNDNEADDNWRLLFPLPMWREQRLVTSVPNTCGTTLNAIYRRLPSLIPANASFHPVSSPVAPPHRPARPPALNAIYRHLPSLILPHAPLPPPPRYN